MHLSFMFLKICKGINKHFALVSYERKQYQKYFLYIKTTSNICIDLDFMLSI